MTTIIMLPQASPATRVPTQRGGGADASGQRSDDFAAAMSAAERPERTERPGERTAGRPDGTAGRDASDDAGPQATAGDGDAAMPLTVAQIVQEAAGLLAEVGGTADASATGTSAAGTAAPGSATGADAEATGAETGLAPVIDLAAHGAGRTAPADATGAGMGAPAGSDTGAAAVGAVLPAAATGVAPEGADGAVPAPHLTSVGTGTGAAVASPLASGDEATGTPQATVLGAGSAGTRPTELRAGAAVDAASTPATDAVRAPAPDGVTPNAGSTTAGSSSAGLTIAGPTAGTPTTAPAPSPAPAAPHTAVEPQALAAQLGTRLSALRVAPAGEHVLVLRVDPETFGPVRVVAHIGTEGVRIELLGASDQARDALRAALPDLRRDLAAAGLPADLDLGADGRADGRADARDGRAGSEGTKDRRRPEGDGATPTPDHPTPTAPRTHRGLDLLA